ncbi:GlsB/YeaQ/YmgE family stress response membrane protein [Rhodococcus sp. O3]|uniref:GlsB/YeaQ/YmgE family stress response membrane protein n=1 Tax=Rhodococcus sp. O3 TaxID=3404919 RepID=UPI003B66ECA7
MLIIGIILFGLLVGAVAQLVVGKSKSGIDWTLAFVAGVGGSFLGGLIVSLLAGDGLALRPSGIIGSIAGAIIVTALWSWWKSRSASPVD